jgi:hypothetical protein
MSNPLGIHVIGRGFGESVVLQMPNGRVGVIDCFAARLDARTHEERLDANPTLRFLADELKAERLAFVAFSHPHEDHGHGLRHILEEYRGRIDELWVFRAFHNIYLERHMKARLVGRRRLPVETLLARPAGTFAIELMRLRNLVSELTDAADREAAEFHDFAGYRRFTFAGEPLTLHVIGPTARVVAEYEQALADNMTGLVDETGTRVNPDWKPDEIDHNRVCAALVVEYGKTRVILGADMITRAWAAVLAEIDRGTEYALSLNCHLIKVSHHGSMTGHCEQLYESHFARPRGKKPIAVVTPFNRHHHPLPSAEGVDHLRAHTSLLLTTNLAEAHHACGRLPTDYIPIPGGTGEVCIPLTWANDISADPALRGALMPSETKGTEILPPPATVPFPWSHDLIANPPLARLLHPKLRRQRITEEELRSAVPERDCRVSLHFNDKGMELPKRRYVGPRAGQLT